MNIIRSEIREPLLQMYGKEIVESVERMSASSTSQYSFKWLCEFAAQWNYITEKLKKMYGKKLSDITFVPVSADRSGE